MKSCTAALKFSNGSGTGKNECFSGENRCSCVCQVKNLFCVNSANNTQKMLDIVRKSKKHRKTKNKTKPAWKRAALTKHNNNNNRIKYRKNPTIDAAPHVQLTTSTMKAEKQNEIKLN